VSQKLLQRYGQAVIAFFSEIAAYFDAHRSDYYPASSRFLGG